MSPKTTPEIAMEILSYFLRNPNAADDLEGIAQWRLPDERINRSVDETLRGVEWLVREGFLSRVQSTGTAPLFLLRAEARARAESLLAQSQHDETKGQE
jgi:hypothetical protein